MAENRKIRGNDIRPRRVDCEQDVTVAGASIADAASGVFIQSDEPTDPPNGARWTDTSTQPPRTKIYDDSSSAWIPINAGDRTFVQDTEPDDLLQGDIWFDTSPEDGTDMVWFDGSSLNFLQFISAIPESELTQIASHIWWMDEGDNSTIEDSQGDADGSVSEADWVRGQGGVGNAYLDFEDGDAIANCGNIFTDQDEFTVSVWGIPQDISNGYIVQQGGADFLIRVKDGDWRITVGGNADDDPISPNYGDWEMATCTYANGTATLYLNDGTTNESFSTSDPSWSSSDDFTFGNRPSDLARAWTDGIDAGLVAFEEASQSQIADHYNETVEFYE